MYQKINTYISTFEWKDISIWGCSHMTSDFLSPFFTYLPTHVRFCPIKWVLFYLVVSDFSKPTYQPKNRKSYVDYPLVTKGCRVVHDLTLVFLRVDILVGAVPLETVSENSSCKLNKDLWSNIKNILHAKTKNLSGYMFLFFSFFFFDCSWI